MKRLIDRLAIAYLLIQGLATIAWWAAMLIRPQWRRLFLAGEAPDSTLLAFLVGDIALFAGCSIIAAIGLAQRRAWAWPVVCIHCGAAVYAALFCISLAGMTGSAWLGAMLMVPPLIISPWLVWHFRPRPDTAP